MIQSLNLFPRLVGQNNGPRPSALKDIRTEQVALPAATRIVFHTEPTTPGADRIRYLRMRLREPWEAGKLRTLLITSPSAHEGKSTIAINLATALAEGGKRTVILVEADLHHSPLRDQFGLPAGSDGLAECLESGLNPLSAAIRLEPLGWYLLPAGKPVAHPAELLQTKALSGVMQKLLPHFDWILIDAPPVLPLTDALSLKQHADASLMVVRAGSTPKAAIEEAITLVGGQHVFGIVLNGVEEANSLYHKSGYYRPSD
jgi:capsular exopolysaccharide synthesis family protein